MSVEISTEEAYAYAEILEILSFTHVSLTEKVPQKLISVFKKHALSTYEHHLKQNIPLEDQDISSETANILTLISLNYWCSPEEKKELQSILLENENNYAKELEEKYNTNNIFNNTKQNAYELDNSKIESSSQNVIENNLPLDTKTLPWYKKLIVNLKEIISKIIKK